MKTITMKKIVLLPVLWLLICAYPLSAKVIRVNPSEPADPQENMYNNLVFAYNDAVNGDTIYIEPSQTSHGDMVITKRLTFIGGGYFHAENEGLTAQPHVTSITGNWSFNTGSAGSKVIGLSFTANRRGIFLNTNDIEILNCYFSGLANPAIGGFIFPINFGTNISKVTVSGCYFTQSSNEEYGLVFRGGPVTNLVFTNNIAERRLNIADQTTGIISNNLIRSLDFKVGLNSSLQIHNNIFLETTSIVLPTPIGSNLSHNIADNGYFGDENNNLENISEGEIFVGGQSPDAKYLIKENGPADGAGRDGVDIGPFGGPKPYKLSGLPDIPNIYDFSTSGIATPEGKLPVTIKVRAN